MTGVAAVDRAWATIPAPLPPGLRTHHEEALAVARNALPAAGYRAAFAKGSTMDQAEAIAFALGESPRPGPASRLGGPRLTRREQDVAALVARGMSNSQIAATLVFSVRTVETHVQHIMDKLGCSSRAQIAAWSAAQPPR
jgi:DNA-binding NarL/FixJ family response regulator